MDPNKFLHIADLHLIENLHLKTSEENLHHYKIKQQILHYLEILIIKENIGAVLISGDIEAENPHKIYPFFKKWLDLGVRIFIVFGDHDMPVMRKNFKHVFRNESYFYVIEEGRLIKDRSLNFNVYGLSCGPRQEGFLDAFKELSIKPTKRPTVFLTHPYKLPKMKMRELGCAYFATGHIHHFCIEEINENIFLGRPGHLYSYWDGDGKAWPTGGIIGEFNNNNLALQQILFPVPQTVRFFIDPFEKRDGKVLFNIENCLEKQGERLKHLIDGQWCNYGFRGVFHGFIENNRQDIEKFVQNMLMIFKDDLFVTPSDRDKMRKKYGYTRAVFSAKHLLEHQGDFQEFIDRSFKATKNTQ